MDPIWRIFHKRNTEKYRMKWIKGAIKAMKKEGLIFEKILGEGSFGDVVKVREMENKKKFAVKIICKSMTWEGEIKIWKDLKNPNVLPLVRLIRLADMDLFVMPLHKKTLDEFAKDKKFLKRPDAFAITKNWMADVGSGLNFMHAKGIAHLDLKSDNVLISKEMHAIICDFSCINVTGVKIDRCGLTAYYRPPEADKDRFSGADVEGASFDMWSFGLLGLFLWSGQWFENQVRCAENWIYDVYPLLFQALQHEHFYKFLVKTFPRSSVTREDAELSLNFVQSTLRYHRQDRPHIETVLGHGLWTSESHKMLTPDIMWMQKNRITEYLSHKSREKTDMEGCSENIYGSPSSDQKVYAVTEGACIDAKNKAQSYEECIAPVASTENIEGLSGKEQADSGFITHFTEVFGVTAGNPVEWSTTNNWTMGQVDKGLSGTEQTDSGFITHFTEVFGVTAGNKVECSTTEKWTMGQGDKGLAGTEQANSGFVTHFTEVFGVTAGNKFEWSTTNNWTRGQGDKEDLNVQITPKYDINDDTETVVKDTIQISQPCAPEAHPETTPVDEIMEGQSSEVLDAIVTTQPNEECSAHVPQKQRKFGVIRGFFLSVWDMLNPRSGKQKLK